MTGMLASVENLAEALCVLDIGPDIIDLKAPALGALGALPVDTVREIVATINKRCPVSATVGDLPMQAQTVLPAVEAMAATGVDYVKIGFFPGDGWNQTVAALQPVTARGSRLIAVLFGDQKPALSFIKALSEAGFTGVMLDTMDKNSGSLTQVYPRASLCEFVAEARRHGLICGLAGSLRQTDIPPLLDLRPDYLGFRGALCVRHERTARLDKDAALAIRVCFSQSKG